MFRLVRCVVCVYKKDIKFGNVNFSTGSGVAVSSNRKVKIADYYADKSVLITGGTGFLGKVFIERLLFNCKDIKTIYVLIRPKKGEDVGKRLHNMLDVPLFQKLKSIRPNDLQKVVAVAGDITTPNLGISDADEQTLINKAAVVIHSAATVRFADPFDYIMNVNLEGTKNVMDLSKKMKNLDTFVYISTAYSNSNRKVIEEKVYPPPKDVEKVRQFVRDHGTNEDKVTEFLAGYPNTYALSKCLCEGLIEQHRGNMPSIIVRPSIVGPVYREPLQGWVDSWVAATALNSHIAKGLVPIMYGNRDVIADNIPVDYVSNLTILAAAHGNQTKDVLVYNICSSAENPVSWKQGADYFLEESRNHGYCKRKVRKVILTTSPTIAKSVTFLLQTIPSFIADAGLVIRGRKPWHLKEQRRAIWLRDLLYPFCTTSWLMKCKRSLSVFSSLDEEDRKTFYCDPNDINWKEYFSISCKGVKQYLLKK